ncbi:MAG: FGGY-family carbohydrate kinase [Candidatus Thorarchaeota archaeon]
MSEFICVFDVGTTGARTIIFDSSGSEIVKAYEEYPVVKQSVGISEQDPIIWWNAIKNTCNKVVKSDLFDPNDIIGIVPTYSRLTLTIIDNEGKILYPGLTWMDEREISDTKALKEKEGLRRAIPKVIWIKNERPDLFSRAFKIISLDSYTYMKLCDKFVTDPTIGIYSFLNLETLKWDEDLADSYNISIDLLPELHTPGEKVGELSSMAAEELGLNQNLPIILGGGDQQCAALGLGVIHSGEAKITTGTGIFVDLIVDKPIPSVGDIPIFSIPHVIKDKWLIEGTMPGTGTMFKWFKDNFSQWQINECERQNINIYDSLTAEAEKVPPGSDGLLFVPLYVFRKGTIHGLGWNHTRAHVSRAIMESAALSAQMYLQLLEGMAKVKKAEVAVDGGGMNSRIWAQMFADIIEKDIKVPAIKDGAALGAAILGFYGCKKYQNIELAIDNMVKFNDTISPIRENTKIYRKLKRLFMPLVLETLNKKRVTKDL